MKEHKFGYKEAITHGFDATKKNFKIILLFLFIVLAITNVPQSIMKIYDGEHILPKEAIKSLHPQSTQQDLFYEYLQFEGYIDYDGSVLDKLDNLKSADNLSLTDELGDNREEAFDFLKHYAYRLPFPKPVYYVLLFLLWLLDMFIMLATIKILIKLSRDQHPSINDLFSNRHLLLSYIFGNLCYTLAIFCGAILFIIPGIILGIGLQFYSYFIVDQEQGPIESLKSSRQITNGSKWRLFVFALLLALINFAGALCLGIGLLF
ncbi:MAG: putative membrane protein SpoIIM required for sporulation, partial [Candidatus Omnitrophota bacterium]